MGGPGMARVPERQVPGVHHKRVGTDVVVTAVSDGHLDGSMAGIPEIEPEGARRMVRDALRPGPRPARLGGKMGGPGMARVPERQVPGVHHKRVGTDVVVTAVSDGHLDGSMAVIQNIEPEEAARMLRDAFRPVPRRTAVNTFLIHAGGKLALVDTGCGDAMAATAGRLFANLAAAGVRPGEVDAVLDRKSVVLGNGVDHGGRR